MSICSKITQNAEKLSAISAVIGGALDDANDALENAIITLSPFVEGTGDGEGGGDGGTGAGNTGGGNGETGGETI